MNKCYICKKDKERHDIRPYGENGQYLCFTCMKSSAELEAMAFNNYKNLLANARKQTDCNAVVLTNDGPTPVMDGRVYAIDNSSTQL